MKYAAKIMSLALCAAVLLSLPAVAAETSPVPENPAPEIPAPVSVWGKVTKQQDGSLLITSTEQDAVNPEVVVRLPEGTPCVDAATGLPLDLAKVKDGDILYVWAGPAMTLSLPPQTTALVVVGNVKSGSAVPQYYEIIGAGGFAILTADSPSPRPQIQFPVAGGDNLFVPDSAHVTPWLTRQIVTVDDLVPGSQVLVWRDKDGKVEKVLLFPYTYRGYMSYQCWDGQIRVDGQPLEAKGIATEHWWDPQYLPLRAVAEAVNYDVSWVKGQGAVVKEGDKVLFSVLPGTETAVRPGNEDGDWELTAPCMIENGVTYLLAGDLAMLLNLYYRNA